MAEGSDLASEIKSFARENEATIKAEMIRRMTEFTETTTVENYIEKFDEGSREHGAMTVEKLLGENWGLHGCKELKDLFWYVAIEMFVAENRVKLEALLSQSAGGQG